MVSHALLKRTYSTPTGMFGTLALDGSKRRYCVAELPWMANQENVSCVPAGQYTALRFYSPLHKRIVFALQNVPDRKNIEIHIGCIPQRDSKGCILIGTGFDIIYYSVPPIITAPGIMGSTPAFENWMDELKGVNEISLTIQEFL